MEAVNGNSVAVDERATGVFLGPDPYRELELYLEKVNAEIGEVFENWTTPIKKTDVNICRSLNSHLSNRCKLKNFSESDATIKNGLNGKNKIFNSIDQNKIVNYNGNEKTILNNGRLNGTKSPINTYDDILDEDISHGCVVELNNIYQRLLNITASQSEEMAHLNMEDPESDHDYDDVFSSGDENEYRESTPESILYNHIETPSKSQDVKDKNRRYNANGIPIPQQRKLFDLINSLHPNKSNFLRKNREQIPSLITPRPGDAVLKKIVNLPDSELISPTSPPPFYSLQDKSVTPDGSLKINPDQLFIKRKDLVSKSVNNSPNLSPKYSHNGHFTWSKVAQKHKNENQDKLKSNSVMADDKNWKLLNTNGLQEPEKRNGDLNNKLARRKNIDRDIFCSQDSFAWLSKSDDADIIFQMEKAPSVTTCVMKDMETQTTDTPPFSRSSSCTCLSECSSSVFNTGSNASASEDEVATLDDDIISSSSSGNDVGIGSQGGGGEESGIGTASPPPRPRKDQEPGQNKCKRKETWERLRRRQSNNQRYPLYFRSSGNDVWIRRENVTTQTMDFDDDNIHLENTYNTEDMSSNENLLSDYSHVDASMSDNSLRKHIFSRKYNDSNQSSSGFESSVNTVDQLEEDLKQLQKKPVRPSFLQLKTVGLDSFSNIDSPSSSGDCLDDGPDFKGYLSQLAGRDQPSPSTASLKLSTPPLPMDLGSKCSSVPVLKKNNARNGSLRRDKTENDEENLPHRPRAQSEKHISEIEASEACKWLRAAGFPQYAQMYEDMQFPIDVSGVQSDHPFLDADSLQSLFRRLAALNRCANMKLEHQHAPKHAHEESDEENQCALSENWQFERKSRRWSRVVDINPQAQQRLQAIADRAIAEQNARSQADRLDTDLLTVPGQEALGAGQDDQQHTRFRRSGSERFRDGAKAFLRHVESFKSKKKKRHNRDGLVISSPIDVISMNEKMKELNCFDVSPSANIDYIDFSPSPLRSHPPSPLATMPSSPMTSVAPSFIGQLKLTPTPFGDDSSSYCSDGSQGSGHRTSTRSKLGSRAKKLLHKSIRPDDSGALSDSECQPSSWRHHYFKDANSNNTKVKIDPPSPEAPPPRERRLSPCPSPVPFARERSCSPAHRPAARTGSLNLGKDNSKYKEGSLKREKSASGSELSGSQDSAGSQHEELQDKVHAEITIRNKGNNNVQRWHSFQRSSSLGSRPTSALVIPVPVQPQGEDLGVRPMTAMSCGQLQVLRKLALLKLTAFMERHCPTHRTGWNWELPKFIRKIKAPDYKDKTVFGVPLLVSLQRTGHALPKPIRTALSWLRNNALDQVGIFRKAGVRSRTLRLRQLAESAGVTGVGNAHNTSSPPPPPATLSPYDEQQAHDVADMVKQYFRELPDALLTNKLSETFIAIFQHVPQEFKEEAVQSALLLLPEEHREALQVVLAFLQQVADHSATNQMTASNLAVCLAPTLLRLHHAQGQGNSNKEGNSNRSASASPRRKRGGTGGSTKITAPDPRELNESKAAHDCLLFLIKKHRELFNISNETLQRCNFSSFEESIPVSLDDLGADLKEGWVSYQEASVQALLKEAREKSRGWVSVSSHEPHVDLCYRKVGDGHPLRLWRITTEVEAPPLEVLNRILRERQIWDDSLLKCRIVERLNLQAEIFQYVIASMAPLQAKDYCVLRSWQTEMPRGGCCVVETSISHPEAEVMLGGVRAVVLASRYLIEPAGKGRSRLVHLARVDTKGRTPEWYNKSYGHLCTLYSARIRASFKHNTDGPESNV